MVIGWESRSVRISSLMVRSNVPVLVPFSRTCATGPEPLTGAPGSTRLAANLHSPLAQLAFQSGGMIGIRPGIEESIRERALKPSTRLGS